MHQPIEEARPQEKTADQKRALFESYYRGWTLADMGMPPDPTGPPGPVGEERKEYHRRGHAARRLADREGETPSWTAEERT